MYEIEVPLGVESSSGALVIPKLTPREPHVRVVVEGGVYDSERFTRKVKNVIGDVAHIHHVSGTEPRSAMGELREIADRSHALPPAVVVLDIQKPVAYLWGEQEQDSLFDFILSAATRRVHIILFANYAILRDFKASRTLRIIDDSGVVRADLGSNLFRPFGDYSQ